MTYRNALSGPDASYDEVAAYDRNSLDFSPYPETGTALPPEGGNRLGEVRSYDPSWRDRLAALITGDDRDPFRRLFAQRLLGTSGLGPSADPNEPWRAMPVAAPAIDAAEAAWKDQHVPFATRALDAGLEAAGAGNLRGAFMRAGARPFTSASREPERFKQAIMDPKTGKAVGDVYGSVVGNTAYISEAGRVMPDYSGRRDPNSIGYREMRRVFNALQEQFPNISRVTSMRISGGRHGPAAGYRSKDGYVIAGTDRWPSKMNIKVQPLWERILNQADKAGIR